MRDKIPRRHIRRLIFAGTSALLLLGVVIVAPSGQADSIDVGSDLCHESRLRPTTVGFPPKTEFDSYQLTVHKGPRVYKLYTHTDGPEIPTDLHSLVDFLNQNPEASFFVDGCGGGVAKIRTQDSGSDTVARFIFSGSTLYWDIPASSFTETIGQINLKYAELGFEDALGTPTTDEIATPTKDGRFNHFTKGSIYWSPATGAHVVKGAIRGKWASLGWETGDIGFPTTDELATPNGVGRFNHFENGYSIYWSPATDAHVVYGQIRETWAALGWENSQLGFPTSDEFDTSDGGRQQDFQNNCYIRWYPDRGAKAFCTSIPRF